MRRVLVPVLLLLVTMLPALPAGAATSYEVHHVEYRTVAGDVVTLRVEVQRDLRHDAAGQPVILTLSPYNNIGSAISGGPTADDGIAAAYNARGYARAVADVIGTRGSTGCWDYGGLDEQGSGVAVVEFLAGNRTDTLDGEGTTLEWSNGNVGMIGGSYDGTTAFMVAETGTPGLAGIVPQVAISRWYDYSYENGVRYFLNSFSPTDEGFDTPLAFDFGFGRTLEPTDAVNDPEGLARVAPHRTGECGSIEHTQEAYSTTPEYDQFWLDRDYLAGAAYRAPALITAGWQDFNVKQVNSTRAFQQIPEDDPQTAEVEGVPFKLLWMEQHTHAGPGRSEFDQLLGCFWAVTLQDLAPEDAVSDLACDGSGHALLLQMLDGRPVLSETRNDAGEIDPAAPASERLAADWPIPSSGDVTLHLGRTFDYDVDGLPQDGLVGSTGESGILSPVAQDTGPWTWVDTGHASELIVENDPLHEPGHGYYSLYYQSAPLEQAVRVAGRVRVDTWLRPTVAGGAHFTPVVLDVAPDGSMHVMGRALLNLDFRNGNGVAEPAADGEWVHAVVETLPQDYTFEAGHRMALLTMSSNTIWAVPGTRSGPVDIANGPIADVTDVGTTVTFPIVDPPADPATLFPADAPTTPDGARGARLILTRLGGPITW